MTSRSSSSLHGAIQNAITAAPAAVAKRELRSPPFSISSAVEQSPVKGKVAGSIPALRAMREVAEAQSEYPGRRSKPREDGGLATVSLLGGVILPSRRMVLKNETSVMVRCDGQPFDSA